MSNIPPLQELALKTLSLYELELYTRSNRVSSSSGAEATFASLKMPPSVMKLIINERDKKRKKKMSVRVDSHGFYSEDVGLALPPLHLL